MVHRTNANAFNLPNAMSSSLSANSQTAASKHTSSTESMASPPTLAVSILQRPPAMLVLTLPISTPTLQTPR